MFAHQGLSEGREGTVRVEDVEEEAMEQFLTVSSHKNKIRNLFFSIFEIYFQFLYSGHVPDMPAHAEKLFVAADKYNVKGLKNMARYCKLPY